MKKIWSAALFLLLAVGSVFLAHFGRHNPKLTRDVLGIWVVNGGISVVHFVLNKWRPRSDRYGLMGLYAVLLPAGLLAWMSDPGMWATFPLTLGGTVLLWSTPRAAEAA